MWMVMVVGVAWRWWCEVCVDLCWLIAENGIGDNFCKLWITLWISCDFVWITWKLNGDKFEDMDDG